MYTILCCELFLCWETQQTVILIFHNHWKLQQRMKTVDFKCILCVTNFKNVMCY